MWSCCCRKGRQNLSPIPEPCRRAAGTFSSPYTLPALKQGFSTRLEGTFRNGDCQHNSQYISPINAPLVVVRGGRSAGLEPDLVVGVEVRCVLALGAEKRILDGMLLAKA